VILTDLSGRKRYEDNGRQTAQVFWQSDQKSAQDELKCIKSKRHKCFAHAFMSLRYMRMNIICCTMAAQTALVTLFERRHLEQTVMVLGVPFSITLTFFMLGFQALLVLLTE